MAKSDGRGIGDNLRPQAGEDTTKRLAGDYAAVEATAIALLDKARTLPTTVESEEQLAAFAESIRDIRAHHKHVEGLRIIEKEPFLKGGAAVDGWFGAIKDRLSKAIKILSLRVDNYQAEKIEREREARKAAEREAMAEAARREKELLALKKASEPEKARALLDAKIAAQAAQMAQIKAEASDAELGRQHFAAGGMVTARAEPIIEVFDWDAVPLDLLRPYLKREVLLSAINAWARARGYKEQMAGVHIELQSRAVVR